MRADRATEGETRVLLLRHGEVASHRGDVPVTGAGLDHAERVGVAIAAGLRGPVALLFGGTRRSRETAEALRRGIGAAARAAPVDSFALRNPDLYAAGRRVDMVSSAAALAEQVPGMTEAQVEGTPWWVEFFVHPDRIGWWLRHADPPGENAHDLATRVKRFARSLGRPGPLQGQDVVGVTHSPLLRAVLLETTGDDVGEPGYVTGVELRITPVGDVAVAPWSADVEGDRR